jgi:hypothetical protein
VGEGLLAVGADVGRLEGAPVGPLDADDPAEGWVPDPVPFDPLPFDPFAFDPLPLVPVDVGGVELLGVAEAELLASAASSACCRASFAEASSDVAEVTASFKAVGSMVARTSPAATLSPTWAWTAVTVPAAGNDAESDVTLSRAPLPARDWVTSPVVAVVVT